MVGLDAWNGDDVPFRAEPTVEMNEERQCYSVDDHSWHIWSEAGSGEEWLYCPGHVSFLTVDEIEPQDERSFENPAVAHSQTSSENSEENCTVDETETVTIVSADGSTVTHSYSSAKTSEENCTVGERQTRPSWDEIWLSVADDMATRSLCEGRQVGAVIVSAQNRIVATGYNGPPAGLRTDDKPCREWCLRQKNRREGIDALSYGLSCPTVHAELNALVFADRRDYEGGTIYVTAACCQDCAKVVANSGVARVVMRVDERDEHREPSATIDFIRECGIDVRTV